MADMIKACIDRYLPLERRIEAGRRALEETPANVPMGHVERRGTERVFNREELALLAGVNWERGRTLRVSFMDGDPQVQERVQPFAKQWEEYANVKLDFGDDPEAEIRISFAQEGSWSYMGVQCLGIPANEPTMNYGWLDMDTEDEEYERVVVHEFGHALGCIHEHQNPSVSIPWDKEAVYRYYGGPPNNWDRQTIDHNILDHYAKDQTQFSQFDPESIMLYPVPEELTIGDYAVGFNTHLSAMDKQYIGTIYPFTDASAKALVLGQPAEGQIGRHGQEDLYEVRIGDDGQYVVATSGRTDVAMGVFGPDDQTRLVAEDDDSGGDYNAQIVARLTPGLYTVRVRHHDPEGQGKYAVAIYPAGSTEAPASAEDRKAAPAG
jgi:hypothetical protein